MVSTKEAYCVPGIWGPYYNAMIPGMWLNEAGQSVTGKLIDHLIETHPASASLNKISKANNTSLYEAINFIELKSIKKSP